MCKNRVIYGFLGSLWVLITMHHGNNATRYDVPDLVPGTQTMHQVCMRTVLPAGLVSMFNGFLEANRSFLTAAGAGCFARTYLVRTCS